MVRMCPLSKVVGHWARKCHIHVLTWSGDLNFIARDIFEHNAFIEVHLTVSSWVTMLMDGRRTFKRIRYVDRNIGPTFLNINVRGRVWWIDDYMGFFEFYFMCARGFGCSVDRKISAFVLALFTRAVSVSRFRISRFRIWCTHKYTKSVAKPSELWTSSCRVGIYWGMKGSSVSLCAGDVNSLVLLLSDYSSLKTFSYFRSIAKFSSSMLRNIIFDLDLWF